jgi:hypothetical protein
MAALPEYRHSQKQKDIPSTTHGLVNHLGYKHLGSDVLIPFYLSKKFVYNDCVLKKIKIHNIFMCSEDINKSVLFYEFMKPIDFSNIPRY